MLQTTQAQFDIWLLQFSFSGLHGHMCIRWNTCVKSEITKALLRPSGFFESKLSPKAFQTTKKKKAIMCRKRRRINQQHHQPFYIHTFEALQFAPTQNLFHGFRHGRPIKIDSVQ